MSDRNHQLSVLRQAELPGVGRGRVSYGSEPFGDADHRLMKRIDELHLEPPFAGSRMPRDMLSRVDRAVGRKHVWALDVACLPVARGWRHGLGQSAGTGTGSMPLLLESAFRPYGGEG